MKFFGEPFPNKDFPAPIFVNAEEVATPVGELCEYCSEPIEQGQTGFLFTYFGTRDEEIPWHRHCMLVSVVGEKTAAIAEKQALEEFGEPQESHELPPDYWETAE